MPVTISDLADKSGPHESPYEHQSRFSCCLIYVCACISAILSCVLALSLSCNLLGQGGRLARRPCRPTSTCCADPTPPTPSPPTSMRQADSHPDRISRARTIVFRVLLVLFVVGRHVGSHRYSDFRGFIWTYKQQDSFTSAYIIGIGIYITNTNILAGCAPKAWRRPEL